MVDFINSIFNNDYNILNIGDKVGHTCYIDFIKPDEVNYPIMKGTDKYNRKFLTIKAKFLYKNDTNEDTFTTIFQRYCDSEKLYMACSNYNKYFMYSEGGLSKVQLEFIDKLLKEKIINLDDDIIENCRLKYNNLDKPISLCIS